MKTRRFLSPIMLMITVLLCITACGPSLEEMTLEKYGITMTAPKLDVTPEFTNLKITDRDTKISRYDFKIGRRVNVVEIEKRIFPDNLSMLKNAISSDENFVEIIETKEFANGVFGAIFKKKGSSGKEIQYYLFYFSKDNRYFRMEPVFNTDLKDLDLQLAAYESMK